METIVADTILTQIRALDFWALGAWGLCYFEKTEDARSFRVRGSKFTGKIAVH